MPRLDQALINHIAGELADVADDEETFWDTLDGETDVMTVVGSVLGQYNELSQSVSAITALMDKYETRRHTMQQRQKRLVNVLQLIMTATNQTKIPHPYGTAYVRKGSERVVITDEGEIPTQLTKTVKTPDKAAIKAQLKQGVKIDGAELQVGPDSISIRMK